MLALSPCCFLFALDKVEHAGCKKRNLVRQIKLCATRWSVRSIVLPLILERSFSTGHLSLSEVVCCTAPGLISRDISIVPGPSPASALNPACLHLQLTHPALPVLPSCVSYLMIVTYLPWISALLSHRPSTSAQYCLVKDETN